MEMFPQLSAKTFGGKRLNSLSLEREGPGKVRRAEQLGAGEVVTLFGMTGSCRTGRWPHSAEIGVLRRPSALVAVWNMAGCSKQRIRGPVSADNGKYVVSGLRGTEGGWSSQESREEE